MQEMFPNNQIFNRDESHDVTEENRNSTSVLCPSWCASCSLLNLLFEDEDALPLLRRQHGDLFWGQLQDLHDESSLEKKRRIVFSMQAKGKTQSRVRLPLFLFSTQQHWLHLCKTCSPPQATHTLNDLQSVNSSADID